MTKINLKYTYGCFLLLYSCFHAKNGYLDCNVRSIITYYWITPIIRFKGQWKNKVFFANLFGNFFICLSICQYIFKGFFFELLYRLPHARSPGKGTCKKSRSLEYFHAKFCFFKTISCKAEFRILETLLVLLFHHFSFLSCLILYKTQVRETTPDSYNLHFAK